MTETSQDIRHKLLTAQLPNIPQVLLKLLDYCQSDDVDVTELAKLIEQDPAMASKVISAANSSAFHRSGGGKVSIEPSIIAIGMEMIRVLVINESVYQTVNGFVPSNGIDLRSYWKRSLTTASIARDIAKHMEYPLIDEAYLAGLLHDLGRLALLAISPNKYLPYFYKKDDQSLCTLEDENFCISHPEAGAWLVEHWNLNSSLADSILYHHSEHETLRDSSPLVRILATAHHLVSKQLDDLISDEDGVLCGMNEDDIHAALLSAEINVAQAAEILGLDLTDIDENPIATTDLQSYTKPALDESLHDFAGTSEVGRVLEKKQNETALLTAIVQSAYILFKIEKSVVFLTDSSQKYLVSTPVNKYQEPLAGLSIGIQDESVIARVANKQQPTFIKKNAGNLTTPERQLLNTLEGNLFFCLPFPSKPHCLGVMIGSITSAQKEKLIRSGRFLQTFAKDITRSLEAIRDKAQCISDSISLESQRLAHEINNPLAIIKNYLGILENRLGENKKPNSEISILQDEINRVSSILSRFSESAQTRQQHQTNINHVIHDVARTFRDTGFTSKNTQIIELTNEDIKHTNCDEGVLKQILINLLKNAIEAMPNGGTVTLKNNGAIHHQNKSYLCISVIDNGPGIPKEIYDALGKKNKEKKNTELRGLGLGIIYDLVEKANGHIQCQSRTDGTKFNILLPFS